MEKTDNILVVGSGTAGLVTALILKTRFPHKEIAVLSSSNIGIIGVGEGSTEHWQEFIDYVKISKEELICETDATLKYGIMFTNWVKEPYFQSVQQPYNFRYGLYHPIYAKAIGYGLQSKDVTLKETWDSVISKNILNEKITISQYHFNTFKLNEYLCKICEQRGIKLIDDTITDMQLNDDGCIKSLIGKNSVYNYDFFIDSTGFKRLLINKLGAEWESYSEYLKMKSAITFQTPEEEIIPCWTLAHAMDYGWLFRIPILDRFGNGYVFDSDYINAEQAKEEVEKYFGKKIEIGKQINFDPGALKTVWIKNCVAIGLSASFVEPLEASSIGTTIQQGMLLAHRLEGYTQPVIDSYNKSCRAITENIRDFIIVHYLTDRNDTKFWKDVANLKLPKSLQEKLDIWKNKYPISEDLCYGVNTEYLMFEDINFGLVLHGLKFFNEESIKREYDTLPQFIKNEVDDIMIKLKVSPKNNSTLTHKEYLNYIRKHYKLSKNIDKRMDL